MTEEFLYYIWQFKLWNGQLTTVCGNKVLVEKPGMRNMHAGPDFLNARIRIGDVLWFGNVEIHVKTSDWFFHGHEEDENYQNLILHVVFHNDLENLPHDCPLVVLNEFISQDLIQNYHNLQSPYEFIPCEKFLSEIDDFTLRNFIETLFIQRIENKVNFLENRLKILQGDWEALLFERISYVFGLKVNAEAFELLAKSFPFKILQQVIRKNESVEALLFGQAGFLEVPKDLYQKELQLKYIFLKNKYELQALDNHLFKFLRLRPPNFPTVRIAQLAAMYQFNNQLFNELIHLNDFNSLKTKFSQIQINEYWKTHYNFGTETTKKTEKKITQERLQLLVLNAIVPIQYLFFKIHGEADIEKILQLLESMKPEQNAIIKNYNKIGLKISNALQSQAFLELKKYFCDEKKCLNCKIGNKIIHDAG